MIFWIIQAQENPAELSFDKSNQRQWRSNSISEALHLTGHEVIRWRSSFSHQKKQQLCLGSVLVSTDQYKIQYIQAAAYKRHIGFARIRSHRELASNFCKVAHKYENLPDLIHVGNVPVELCAAAVSFGRIHNIPVVVDIRDLWPDTYVDFTPIVFSLFRPILLKLIRLFYFRVRFIYKHATAINALTQSFLFWGLDWAKRPSSTQDRVFSMAYPCSKRLPPDNDVTALRARLGIDSNNILSCYIGNLGYQSDFDAIIGAALLLKTKFPHFRFILAGSGPKYELLKQSTVHLSNVILPGWLTGVEITTLMYLSVIGYVSYKPVSNYLKNIPNKFPEYLAGGLAIACGLEGEMGALVQQSGCGFIYSPGDAHSLASNLTQLLSDPLTLQNMRTNSRNLHRDRFDAALLYPTIANYLVNLAHQHNCAREIN